MHAYSSRNFTLIYQRKSAALKNLIEAAIVTVKCANENALVKAGETSTYKSVIQEAEREVFSATPSFPGGLRAKIQKNKAFCMISRERFFR